MPNPVPSYYLGEPGELGRVHKLPQTSFGALIGEVLMLPRRLNINRDDYNALDPAIPAEKKKRDDIKNTAYITASHFKTKESPRRKDVAVSADLLTLDIDDSEQARPLYNAPHLLDTLLSPYPFALYRTASSTPENPRVRLVISATRIPVDSYVDAVETIAGMLGLVKLNAESRNCVLPMYLPSLFLDDDVEEEHPVLHYRAEGPAFAIDDITGSDVAAEPDENPLPGSVDDALWFLRAPIPQVGIVEVSQMLERIDPDCGYAAWLEIAMGLKHQFGQGSPGDASKAFELFDSWSARGKKYAGQEDTTAKWKSIRPNVSGRSPVTVRSIMRQAHSSGWDSAPVVKLCFESVARWIDTLAPSLRELLTQGVERIAATPLLSPAEEDILLAMIQDRARDEYRSKPRIISLRAELKKAKQKVFAAGGKNGEASTVPTWAKGWVYVAAPNLFFRYSTGEQLSSEAVDNRFGRELMEQAPGDGEGIDNSTRPVARPRDYLLHYLKIPEVYDFSYDPSDSAEPVVVEGRIKYINTYRPSGPDATPETAKEAGKIFRGHLETLVTDKNYCDILTDFLAYMVQQPGKKIRWAVLLQGAEGCGKTFLARAAGAVLGREHVAEVGANVLIKSDWNDWAAGSQLVSFEEIRVVGKNRHEVMNKIKPVITNDSVSINERFRNMRTVRNYSNYLMFTNYRDALALGEGDRRYFIIESALQTKEQVLALPEGYFERLFGMLERNAGGLRAYLEEWEFSPFFDPDGHAPVTTFRDKLIEGALPEDVIDVYDVIDTVGSPLASRSFIVGSVLKECFQIQNKRMPSSKRLAGILEERGMKQVGRPSINGSRSLVWMAGEPTPEEIEEAFDTARQCAIGEISEELAKMLL